MMISYPPKAFFYPLHFFLKVFCLLLLTFFHNQNSFSQINLTQGLLAYYPFNGNSYDASGNAYHGVLKNGASFSTDRFGNPNASLQLDGIDDFVEIIHDGRLSPRSAFSFVAYFNTQSSAVQTILGRRNQTNSTQAQFQAFINWPVEPGVGYGHQYSNNAECNTVLIPYNQYVNTGINTVNQNQWYCVIGTFDGSVQKIYLDGVLKSSEVTPLSLMDSCANVPMTIGHYTNLDPQNFKGKIDDVRIYNRALSQQEIIALCSTPLSSPCSGFQISLGSSAYDRAFDVTPSLNNEFYTVGITTIVGDDDILISKLDLNKNVIWSKTFGGKNTESVRKTFPTSDGGILIVGQTKSFGNTRGEILCFKVSNAGALIWSKKFEVGSAAGDLGMDVIETTDGGYVISGILNVIGGAADGVVIKLDSVANTVWSKRFDHLDGDDGVGIVQKWDTLIVAIDLQNSAGNYSMVITKLKLNDGSFITAKKLTPDTRGIFNPYLYKNPAQPGYIISGHTIDGSNYSNMKHVVITVNDNLDIISTKLILVNPVTNDFFTSIIPFNDGSFIGCASPRTNADGYIYKISNDNKIVYAKKFNATTDRRLYRLATLGEDVLAVGSTILNGQEDFFIINFKADGALGQNCNVDSANISVEHPSYTSTPYSWPVITNVNFSNTSLTLPSTFINLLKTDLCAKASFDFSFQQNLCNPKSVQFSTNLVGIQTFQWEFGDGKINSNSQTPTNTYASYGIYNVKLKVQYTSGCSDSLTKAIKINTIYENMLVLNEDTAICLGDSVLLKTNTNISNYCWRSTGGYDTTSPYLYVKPDTTTTYRLTSQVTGNNLILNSDFSNGNSAFVSGYAYSTTGVNPGVYNVGSNIISWNPAMATCVDHTSGSGNMMMINGADQSNIVVWSQTISVSPNTDYIFSTWLQNINSINSSQLQLSINGNFLGNIYKANNQSCIWEKFFTTWNSGNNTTATISMLNMNQQIVGNDFALDDIFFGTVTTQTDSFTINVTGLCDSIKIMGSQKVCSKNDTVSYSIYKSSKCTQQYSLFVDNNFADIISSTPTSLQVVFKKNGNTTIKVAFNNSCKIIIDSIDITVKFSPTTIKLPDDITSCRDTLFTINAGEGFASYQWQNSSTDSTFIVNAAGTYTVFAQNSCGTQFTDSFKFFRLEPATFKANPLNVAVCKGDSVQFTASGGTLYLWEPANNFDNSTAPITKALIYSSQNFTVKISDLACLRDTLISIPVVAVSKPDITILKKNDVTCSNDSSVLIASGGISYTWSPNLYISHANNGKITVRPPQTMTYHVVGKNSGGCLGEDSTTVVFIKEGNQKLFIPNAFTPNNDGLNDVFKPTLTGNATQFDFRIYNRWGQLVFRTRNPSEGWDGKFKFVAQPKDVYVYYITAEGGCNGKFEKKGTFVLIK